MVLHLLVGEAEGRFSVSFCFVFVLFCFVRLLSGIEKSQLGAHCLFGVHVSVSSAGSRLY